MPEWLEVENIRPGAGKGWINLALVYKIDRPEKNPGVATLYFVNGETESCEDANLSRLLKAIEDAE